MIMMIMTHPTECQSFSLFCGGRKRQNHDVEKKGTGKKITLGVYQFSDEECFFGGGVIFVFCFWFNTWYCCTNVLEMFFFSCICLIDLTYTTDGTLF